MKPKFTIIHPYYDGGAAISKHLRNWASYPTHIRDNLQFILVDDGSPNEPLEKFLPPKVDVDLSTFRIDVNIPWNDGGARNLAAHFAKADWLIMLDLDKMLIPEEMRKLWDVKLKAKKRFYKFHHPTKGSYANQIVINKEDYLGVGGYNEDHSGGRGGSGRLFRTLEEAQFELKVLPITLRHVGEGRVDSLCRDRMSIEDKAAAAGRPVRQEHEPITMLRFPWHQTR